MQRLERIEDRDEDALTECRIALGRAYFRHGRMQECSAVMASAVMVLDKKHGRDHPSTVAARDLATRLLGRAPIEDWVGEETGREVERLGGRLADGPTTHAPSHRISMGLGLRRPRRGGGWCWPGSRRPRRGARPRPEDSAEAEREVGSPCLALRAEPARDPVRGGARGLGRLQEGSSRTRRPKSEGPR